MKGIIGLQDLNVNYAASEYGSLFINSSFGIPSTIAYNIPSPIFPLTALGFHLEWQPTQHFKWKAAIFDGMPEGFENFHLKWKLNKQNGFLNITEMEWNKNFQENRSGIYKIGAYYHNSRDSMQHTQKNRSFYLLVIKLSINMLEYFLKLQQALLQKVQILFIWVWGLIIKELG